MKKGLIIIIFIVTIFAIVTALYFYNNRNNKPYIIPEGSIVVENTTYGFEFNYPGDRYLHLVDEWDNGLPGSDDGGVYGYRLEGRFAGNFTENWYISIYNKDIDTYLAEHNKNNYRTTKKEKRFNVDVVKYFYDSEGVDSKGNILVGNGYFCNYLMEHNSLLYIIDCKIKNFKFL